MDDSRGASKYTAGTSHRDVVLDLRILATSDLHANLLPWDYHSNRPAPQRGLAPLSSLISEARAEQPQNLLFDNGDFLHGTALGDFLTEARPASSRTIRPVHPMIAAMNHLNYDAVALGNHEFSHGLGFLRRSLARVGFPLVCSNLYFKPSRAAALAQSSLLLRRELRDRLGRKHGLTIGVLGFLPPQTMIWERRYLKSRAAVDDILASARTLVPDLRRRGADIIIALSHSGIGEKGDAPGAENASSSLAELDGIDVVIAGHTHLLFPAGNQTELGGKPVVMPGFFGSHLGLIDLSLQKSRKGWRMAGFQTELRAISARDPGSGQVYARVKNDPAIAALAMPAHTRLLERGGAEFGRTPIPLHSYFALLTETPLLRLVAEAQAAALTKALANGPFADLPMLSAVAPFKAGGRGGPENYTFIPSGPLLTRHLGDIYAHPNSLTGLQVTGSDVALWLERSFSLFQRVLPSAVDGTLIDSAFPSFNFDTIHGLTWQIDLSAPARFDSSGNEINPGARRVVNLCHCGKPVRAKQVFALATNNFRSSGGSGFAGAHPSRVIHDSTDSNRDVIEALLRSGAVPAPLQDPAWRFCEVPEATVVFDTAPDAIRHLSDVPHLRLTPLATLTTGFRRFRLQL